jgi:hypothetical protein
VRIKLGHTRGLGVHQFESDPISMNSAGLDQIWILFDYVLIEFTEKTQSVTVFCYCLACKWQNFGRQCMSLCVSSTELHFNWPSITACPNRFSGLPAAMNIMA